MIKDLIARNRSFRRFHEDYRIDRGALEELVELARLSPSGANLQPLKFILSCDPASNARIFPHLKWAGYLKTWPGPSEGERPSAYVILLRDNEITTNWLIDHGIAAQSMLLGAAEKDLGGCIVGSIDRDRLRADLNIPSRYEILIVLALGKPRERVVLETAVADHIEYWRDADGKHHVPKRPLKELILDLP